MRLTKIQITNFAAFATYEATLPAVSIFEGQNGQGKTSALYALQYGFGRGHDPDVLHGSAEEGELLYTFDDDSQIKARITRKETTRMTKPAGGRRFVPGRAEIDRIADAVSYDPLKFLDKKESEQLAQILKLIPVTVTKEEILAAVGGVINPGNVGASLDAIDGLSESIFNTRTDVNRDAKTLAGHADELDKAIGPEPSAGEDWSMAAARLRNDQSVLAASEQEEIDRIAGEFQAQKDAAAKAQRESDAEIDDGINAQIAAVNAQIAALESSRADKKLTVAQEANVFIESARNKANTEADEIRGANTPRMTALTAEIATAEERAARQHESQGTRIAAQKARAESGEAKERSVALTASLDRLSDLKKKSAEQLTQHGIAISEGRICREESGKLVPLKKWNTADQIAFCLRVAVLAHGPCGLIVVDEIGRFDPERRAELLATCREYAASEGLQFVLGMATDGGLRIVDGGYL